jgi:hypothetical protein
MVSSSRYIPQLTMNEWLRRSRAAGGEERRFCWPEFEGNAGLQLELVFDAGRSEAFGGPLMTADELAGTRITIVEALLVGTGAVPAVWALETGRPRWTALELAALHFWPPISLWNEFADDLCSFVLFCISRLYQKGTILGFKRAKRNQTDHTRWASSNSGRSLPCHMF